MIKTEGPFFGAGGRHSLGEMSIYEFFRVCLIEKWDAMDAEERAEWKERVVEADRANGGTCGLEEEVEELLCLCEVSNESLKRAILNLDYYALRDELREYVDDPDN